MNGWTRIENRLIDWLMELDVSARQMKIVLLTFRNTVCFHREDAEISLSYIENRFGILRRNAQTDIKHLVKIGVLKERFEGQKRFLSLNTVLEFENSEAETVLDFENSTVLENENRTVLNFKNQESKVFKKKKINNDHSDLFNEFWLKYPRKVSKPQAIRSFQTALKKTSFELIIQGLDGYVNHLQNERTETKYIKHPSTWLNAEGWNDYKPVEQVSRILALVAAHSDKEQDDNGLRELYRKSGVKAAGSCSGVAR